LIEDHIPKNAVATRLTDDDFVILLTHSDVSAAIELTEAIRKNSHVLRYLRGDKSLQVTVSAGISKLSRSTTAGDALTALRIACDAAKDHGRDRYEIHDQRNQSIIQRYDDMYLVSEIQKSLDTDAFKLTAQPIVALDSGNRKHRFEILLRMQDDKGNRVSSDAFFSAAERYQLMPQVDRWVVTNTLARLATVADFLTDTGAIFAINLSGQSLGDDALLSFIEEEIDRSGIPSTSLCFEVTESAAVSSRDKACAFINALRQRGCRFSLDDFGAGLSSFAYLKSFNVDVLKIDGGFIRDITENRISESMVAAITQVAKVMELETVAEYVESEETRRLIAELGVDFAQGHATGKPADLDEVLAELTAQSTVSTA
jgi:EAL domain-containing protein (putative c-di-GMP-specific phosphodiesterase class I)